MINVIINDYVFVCFYKFLFDWLIVYFIIDKAHIRTIMDNFVKFYYTFDSVMYKDLNDEYSQKFFKFI